MSERYGREEDLRRREAGERRPLGPDIDAEGRRMDGPRASEGPSRVGAVREEHETRGEGHRSRQTHRGGGEAHWGGSKERGTSWLSVIFGWLAALGAGLILSGIVGAIVGAILGTGGASSSATEGGTTGLIGLLLTLLLAFIIGGYVEPLGPQARPLGPCAGPGGHHSPCRRRNAVGPEFHRQPQWRDAAQLP